MGYGSEKWDGTLRASIKFTWKKLRDIKLFEKNSSKSTEEIALKI